jgi:hypothetical protein
MRIPAAAREVPRSCYVAHGNPNFAKRIGTSSELGIDEKNVARFRAGVGEADFLL